MKVQVWTMQTASVDQAHLAAWRNLLDGGEIARADRFMFESGRQTFIAAHALTRFALARVCGAAPRAFRFVPGQRGKPDAWLGDSPAPLSFNLSHTDGLVGLAVADAPGFALGFDVESLARTVNLAIADRYFRPEEVAWLSSLPARERPQGFLRLWTLKESFIKATGEGLARSLASFWFDPLPPRIRFVAGTDDSPAAWRFEQQVVAGGFLAALGIRSGDENMQTDWAELQPAALHAQT